MGWGGFTQTRLHAGFKYVFFLLLKHVPVRLCAFNYFQMCSLSSARSTSPLFLSSPIRLFLTSNLPHQHRPPPSSTSCVSSAAVCLNEPQFVSVCPKSAREPKVANNRRLLLVPNWNENHQQDLFGTRCWSAEFMLVVHCWRQRWSKQICFCLFLWVSSFV